MQNAIERWVPARSRGFARLDEFSNLVRSVAETCLRSHVFVAQTPDHKFSFVASAMRDAIAQEGVIKLRVRASHIKKFPQLEDAMPLDVDEYDNEPSDLIKFRETIHELNAEIVQQRLDANIFSFNSTAADKNSSLQRNVASSYSMRGIKEHLL